ncbi:hypothetical protein CTI12_AA219110 [Artemisia annua]|uniref:Uncharacterized protein n=1 Tax=Artemisia annua TaxID=35608 RepID=A0A2U1NQX0_ARTAN|nr:hypothetical protein CTI12_AA219110 [Artemisia annua]
MSLKLLVDTKDERVLSAKANKDFVDFLFNIFSIHLGTLIGLLGSKQMVGCLGELKDSIDSFDETYLQPDIIKDDLINPKTPFNGKMLLLSYDDKPATSNTVDRTCTTGTFLSDSDEEDSCDYENEDSCDSEEDSSDSATSCRLRNKIAKVARKRGYVTEVVSYMVMDDLVVKPMSSFSSITLINNFGYEAIGECLEV